MQGFLFDGLGKVLVRAGLVALVTGLAFSAISHSRPRNSDTALFLALMALTLAALTLLWWLHGNETWVRVVGFIFQAAGIAVALYALHDVRTKLGQPGLIAALTQPPVTRVGAALIGEASDHVEAYGTLTTHPRSVPIEQRLTLLEDQVAQLEATHARDMARIRREAEDLQQAMTSRYQQQANALDGLRQLLINIQTGGLPWALYGLIWLAVGAFLSGFPEAVADWIA